MTILINQLYHLLFLLLPPTLAPIFIPSPNLEPIWVIVRLNHPIQINF